MHAAIIYAKFAPFHITRVEAAALAGQKQSHRISGIEIADLQTDYQWPASLNPGQHFSYLPIFPSRDYWTLSYGHIRRALCHLLDDLKPDVIVLPGWGFKEALAGLGWCLRKHVPRVLISETHEMNVLSGNPKVWVKRLLVRQFQAGLVAGAPSLRSLVRLGMSSESCFVGAAVINNALFANESAKSTMCPWDPRPKLSLLSCLRFIPRKNILGVLSALASDALEWTWILVGYGPQQQEIEDRIKVLGLQDRVRLLGYVGYDQLPQLYANVDAYLQPSLFEPWGLAVNEAMACGLPVVVSTPCGCHEDLVQENVNGFTFDPTRPESLGKTLRRLAESKVKREQMGQASRKIIARWGPELFAQNFWRACERALHPAIESPKANAISQALGFVL